MRRSASCCRGLLAFVLPLGVDSFAVAALGAAGLTAGGGIARATASANGSPNAPSKLPPSR
jgi:hypothetical protein